jgi:hypothetical protein
MRCDNHVRGYPLMRAPIAAVLVCAAALSAADKKVAPARAGNDDVDITGSAIISREDVKQALGVDPGMNLVVVDLQIKPKSDAKVTLSRDDFIMISRRDGQRTQAMHPSQIAGSAVMVVTSREAGAGGGMVAPRRGPIWGGIPGTGGRPQRVGGDTDIASVSDAETRAQIGDAKDKENPLLAALKKRELPEGEVSEEKSGLLYFVFEGKHRLKDFELMYKTKGDTLTLDFEK